MPTLQQVRRFVLPLLGPYISGTITGGTVASLVSVLAPFKSSVLSDDTYKDQIIYLPARSVPDNERIVSEYTAATGTFVPDTDWAVAPSAGTFELSSGLLSITAPDSGLHALINDALRRLFIIEEFTLSPVALQTRHSLTSAAAWLTNADWVRQVGVLAAGEDRNKVNPYRRSVRGRPIKIGPTVYLDHPSYTFNAADTLYVKALAPAYDRCADTGSPTVFTASGMGDESDVCQPSVERVGWATVVEAHLRLGNVLSDNADKRVQRNLAVAAQMVTKFNRDELQDEPHRFREVHAWGPRR